MTPIPADIFGSIGDIDIQSLPLLYGLGIAAIVLVGIAIFHHQKLRWRFLEVVLATALALLVAGGFVNRHFDYFDTLDDLLGQQAQDEAPASILATQKGIPKHGYVVPMTIPGTASGFKARQALVYVPPAWFAKPRPKLPVFVLMHGTPGTTADWTRSGDADVTTDTFARQHGGKAPILVLPDINGTFTGDTECVNSKFGNVETYLTQDVRNFVIRRFGAKSDARSWMVGGLSEGATCSVWLALRHPDLWRTFGSFAGRANPQYQDDGVAGTVKTLFDGSVQAYNEHTPSVLLKERKFPELGGWFEVGSKDTLPFEDTNALVPQARAAGIETCYKVIPNGIHNFRVWTQAYKDALPWLAARVGLIPMTAEARASCRR